MPKNFGVLGKKSSKEDTHLLQFYANKKSMFHKNTISDINLVESRLPKLIYAYKKFFKNLNRLRKINNLDQAQDNYEDLYVKSNTHSLEKFESILKRVKLLIY